MDSTGSQPFSGSSTALNLENVDEFMRDGYKILVEAIRTSNSLPQAQNWNFYSTHDAFGKIMNNSSHNVLRQINTILRTNRVEGNIRNRGLEEQTELLIEANDMILEKVANNIDDMNGIRKTVNEPVLIQTVSAELPVNGSWNRSNGTTFSVGSSITTEVNNEKSTKVVSLYAGKNIIRPQKFFKDKIINSSKFPWEPRITEKPNSLKPLAIFLEESPRGEEFSHPYEFELDRFVPPPDQLSKLVPAIPLPLDKTPLVEVTVPEQIDGMVEALRNCKEFAVDLEHHSYRSFMGITCLMQISTKDTDYVIDTLALRDKLHVLNEVFTKPTIVKIFHGADHDIEWLQRDLSIYVVNMFDTYQAAKVLEYSGLGLAYLMQRFCNFMPNKKFQLADWRIRPLPDKLITYAREDTHYLIYIYHKLRNELLEKANGKDNLLISAINQSTEICKKRYFRPEFNKDSYMDFYRKCKRLFDNRQLYALKELYNWRDQISREEDESTGYVLPNHMLLQISENLPREMQGILACCNPIPPLVRSNLLELHQIVLKAKEQPLEQPILQEDTRARGSTKKISKINVDSPLHCPHDLTKSNDFRDDLPTLLTNPKSEDLTVILDIKIDIKKRNPIVSVFDLPEDTRDELSSETRKKIQGVAFLTPFQRYMLVKPYIQAEEEKLANAKAEEQNTDSASKPDRTDEERIESIREHFLHLSKKTPPPDLADNLEQPLIHMGGTKKRKRADSSPKAQPSSSLDTSTTLPSETSAKRKSSDNAADAKPKKKKTRNKKDFWRSKPENNLAKQGDLELPENSRVTFQGEDNQGDDELGGSSRKGRKPRQRNKQKGGGGGGGKSSQETNEDSSVFDYASVDFRQFQGGAGGAPKPQDFKSTFKMKGQKKGFKGNNQSSTFGSFSHSRGGGRGRGGRGGRGSRGGRGGGGKGRGH